MKEQLEAELYCDPFPMMIVYNFYNEAELKLIWKELDFYTAPNKLLDAKKYGGVVDRTNAKALLLDDIYRDRTKEKEKTNFRNISNILTMNRKIFNCGVLDTFSEIHDCVSLANQTNWDVTKVRYYHNDEYYDPHTDSPFQFLAFSYFYKEPKKFKGGDLQFPKYKMNLPCENNSLIIFPGWVEHGVRRVKIEDSDYYDGYGRYAITSFFGIKESKR
tara:strand:+ start:1858 stop:2508 length:651 start_codon:yes stop_codon:yes gene_type:complete